MAGSGSVRHMGAGTPAGEGANRMSRKNVRHVRRGGFTLIEILVVVAIIALLIAILLPSLRNAKEMAKGAACGTQLSQIFNGALMYSHVNQDRLPYFGGWWSFGLGNSEPQWWPTQIARGIGNNFAVFKCPSDRHPSPTPVRWVGGSVVMNLNKLPPVVTLDVTYRGSCDTLEDTRSGYRARKITAWKRPGKIILLVEADVQDPTLTNPHDCFRLRDNLYLLDDRTPNSYNRSVSFQEWKRHVGKTNFLFLDSHVERLTPRQAAKLGSTAEYYQDPNTPTY
jgi:prepilin-type N-terminal cleavage/methylation domain-containing protein/prepilin-type processing-associated H-X9-DG protein